MRTEAEIRQEIARLQALAEIHRADGGRQVWSHAGVREFEAAALKWVLQNS